MKVFVGTMILWAALPIWADVVFLKNGQRLEGELVDKGDACELRTDMAVVSFEKSDVERIVKSPAALLAEAEEIRTRARALFEEAQKIENDPKATNTQIRSAIDLLRKVGDIFAEASDVYAGDKYPDFSKELVKTFQEMRIYRDKLTSEVAGAPPESSARPPEAPVTNPDPPPIAKKEEPAPPAPKAEKPKLDVAALLARAKGGDVEAQYAVAWHYHREEGNWPEALKWYRSAAEKNYVPAYNGLGLLYLVGRGGVKQNLTEAQRWFQRSESSGSPIGPYWMATLYYEGLGVRKDLRKANTLAEKAFPEIRDLARIGNPEAQCFLGWMYLTGMGTYQNEELAFDYYRQAAGQDYVSGLRELGGMYEHGKGCKKDPDKAVQYYEKAAAKGDATAMNNLGHFYNSMQFGPKANLLADDAKAVSWYRKLVEKEDPHGYYNLGLMYMNGKGVRRDEAEGLRLWRHAIKIADDVVYRTLHYAIGNLYAEGRAGLKKDPAEAIRSYKLSADTGYARAMDAMGYTYLELKTFREGIAWCLKGAKGGDHLAQNRLGWCYQNGVGVKKDLGEAEKWYLMAAQRGYEVAIKNLKSLKAEQEASQRKRP